MDQEELIIFASRKLIESTDAAVSAEKVVVDLRDKLVASEKRFEGFSLHLTKAKESLDSNVDVMKEASLG